MAASDNSRFSSRPQGVGLPSGTAPVMPPRAGETVRPGIERPPGSSPPAPAPAAEASAGAAAPRRSETAQRTLIVGREIGLSGEITSCDRLVVEGSVEANLANCREIDIAESGLFKGSASIDDAEIRGRFEGTLIARKRLHIRTTGKVAATVSYAEIEIEPGGQISGTIEVLPATGGSAASASASHPESAYAGNAPRNRDAAGNVASAAGSTSGSAASNAAGNAAPPRGR